jgi:hypothetical protein
MGPLATSCAAGFEWSGGEAVDCSCSSVDLPATETHDKARLGMDDLSRASGEASSRPRAWTRKPWHRREHRPERVITALNARNSRALEKTR